MTPGPIPNFWVGPGDNTRYWELWDLVTSSHQTELPTGWSNWLLVARHYNMNALIGHTPINNIATSVMIHHRGASPSKQQTDLSLHKACEQFAVDDL